jgi:hypothetical protein
LIPTPALGIRFDIDRLGGGAYGLEAWTIFWQAVSRRVISGALLYEGDSSATLSGTERVFVIAVHHQDVTALQRVAAALNGSIRYQAVAASPDFSWNQSVATEPLPEAGRLDGRGALVGGFWAKSALEAVKGGVAPQREDEPKPTPARTCPTCRSKVVAGDKFCGVCGTSLVGARQPAAPVNCPNCGTAVELGDDFCGECGTRLVAEPGVAPVILPAPAAVAPGRPPVWVWVVIGVVVLLLIGTGAFMLLRGGGDSDEEQPAARAAVAGPLPLAGVYTGENPSTFQVILVVLDNGSSTFESVMIACMPEGTIEGLPFAVATDVPITGHAFEVSASSTLIRGSLTQPARAQGTILATEPESLMGCGVPEVETEWSSVCTMAAVRTEEGGFRLEQATAGPCSENQPPRLPPDPVRRPPGPALGQITTTEGVVIVEGFRLTNEYPPGCKSSNSGDSCVGSGNGNLLAVVTVRLEGGGRFEPGVLAPEAVESFLRSPSGVETEIQWFQPSFDRARVDIVYGLLESEDEALPQVLVWPGDRELPVHP